MYIGLTGNIASGKSTVAKLFEQFGVYTIDADEISKIIMSKNGSAYNAIIEYFGKNILNEVNEINRAKLKEIVFNNPKERKILEEIVQPKIIEYEKKLVGKIKGKDSNAIIMTHAALIIEKNTYKRFDKVIVIYISKENQLNRLLKRDNMSLQLAKKIISSQMPIEEKLKYADIIIDNNGTLDDLKSEVDRIIQDLKIYQHCAKLIKKQAKPKKC
jgi:dephospho-CoA kinase